MKSCSGCKETKSYKEFFRHRGTKDGYQSHCGDCHRAMSRQWRVKNPGYHARYKRQERYGLSEDDYQSLFKKQKGSCAVCLKPFGDRRIVVEHCHKTNKVRGLAHYGCNTALGAFSDDPKIVLRAYQYLMSFQNKK